MIESIVPKVQHFRNRLFHLFKYKADATMDLIDALAGPNRESVVKLSLSQLFRRTYCSITDVIDNTFRRKAEQNPEVQELQKAHLKISQLLAEQCSPPNTRGFSLFATDCTAKPRVYSSTVTDRAIVHAPNHVPGQKPITVGHEYSLVVFLPEDRADREAHWTCPLSIRRVQSHETGSRVGLEQIQTLITKTVFQWELCVVVADAAYSTRNWVVNVASIPNLIQIARLRSNRILHQQPPACFVDQMPRGRSVCYGKKFHLGHPPEPDETDQIEKVRFSGKRWIVRVSRWHDLLMRGENAQHMHRFPFDVVQVQVFDENGRLVFKNPLWLIVTGQRRRELSLCAIYESYDQRYDIEHCFRFGKQKLLLARSQTPDTRHEENLMWITMLSFFMLHQVRKLAAVTRFHWEKRKVAALTKTATATQVQRDYERIIRGIGTPACIPKPRGKSPGRQNGAIVPHRNVSPIIRKARPMAARC